MPVTVTAINPTDCSVDGGQAVTITGTQFANGARVTFGGVAATGVAVTSPTQITCTAPAMARGGQVNVVVTNRDATTGTGVNLFEYWATLATIEPATGTTVGGTAVTLTGKGFPALAVVQIGGAAAGAVVVNGTGTRLTCTTPAGGPGSAHVYVFNPGGMGGGRQDAFTYSAPAITGIEPLAVPAAGGPHVTIRGDFFGAGATVSFGGTPSAAPPVVVSARELRVQTPAHAPGRVDVAVTVAGNTSTLTGGFEFQGAQITAIEPAQGPAAGGTDIIITGLRFDTAAAPIVQVGGVAVTNLAVADATRITARTQAMAAGSVDVTVQNVGHPVVTRAGGFKAVAAPTVTKVEPARGALAGGTAITIRGTGFAADATVTVGGVAAGEVRVVSPTTITATTGSHAAGTEAVAVTNPGAPAVSLAAAFTFSAVERIEPARGLPAGGEAVVIQGAGFDGGAVAVTFGGDAAAGVVVDSAQQLTVTTPPRAAGAVDVVVTVAGQATTLAGGFTFSPVTELDPPGGPVAGNTRVTLRGDGIPDGTTVRFGAADAAAVQWISAQELRATTPPVVAGPVDVVLHHDAFDATVARGFTFRAPATVASIEPAHGPVAGNTPVTIGGTGFVEGATATIGGVAATGVTVVSDTTITATTAHGPPPPMGGVRPAYDVVVTNPGAAAATGAGLFRYRDPPPVTAVEPAQGPVAGNRWITVTGRDYVEGAQVLVAGAAATEVTFANDHTLYARVPAHAAGAVSVAVQNPGEAAGPANAGAFTYVTTPAETGDNEVVFLLDGEHYFEQLRQQFDAVRQADPHELTYVRLSFWMIEASVTLGDRNYFEKPNHRLLVYIDQLIRAGHNVDIILWCPAKHHRFQMGAEMATVNGEFGRAVYEVDRAAAAAGPHAGRARAFLEPYEGEVGASNHQKVAIFSIAGVRTAFVGGINLSNHYFAPDDHAGDLLWHDTVVRLRGPVTDDVEAEWMRRWRRTYEIAEYWGWNAVGWGGEMLARDFSFNNAVAVRRRAVRAPENTTRQPPHGDNRAVSIALTRSVGTTRYRDIRDQVIARINAATQYIYFENYHFADPELVQAVVARQLARARAGHSLRVVILVPMQGGASGYMSRRAWLHMALAFETPAPASLPMWHTVWYDLGAGGGEVQVTRATCAAHRVTDTYDAATPWTFRRRWIDGDRFIYRLATGGGDVEVPLDAITRVRGDFSFYTAWHLGTDDNIYKHSKVAIFDDQWLVCGTSNWSYRSMQYDGEIAAFVRSGPVALGARQALLDHYNPTPGGLAAITPANIHVEAAANLRAWDGHDPPRLAMMGDRIVVPLCHHSVHPQLALPRTKPGVQESPNFTWY